MHSHSNSSVGVKVGVVVGLGVGVGLGVHVRIRAKESDPVGVGVGVCVSMPDSCTAMCVRWVKDAYLVHWNSITGFSKRRSPVLSPLGPGPAKTLQPDS